MTAGEVELLLDVASARRALNDFDFDTVAQTLGVSVTRIKNALLTTVMTRIIVEFTPGILKFKPGEEKKLERRGKTILRPYKSHRERVEGIIWARADRECRILLNSALVPAVVEAQKHQNISPMTIASSMSSRQTEPDERLLIVQDYEIGTARNGETFHGCIDCVILLLPRDSYPLIKAGSMPMDDKQGEPLLAIVEAGSPVDWEEARTRLSAQCIALLKSTGRKYFPAVLTNGLIWFFFLAVAHDDGVTIYQSGIMSWTVDAETDGLIVATLVELLRNPAPFFTVPPQYLPAFALNLKFKTESNIEIPMITELLFDVASARRALNDFDFDTVAQTLGVSVTRIKNALLTTVMTRTIVEFTPGILKFKPDEKEKLKRRGKTILRLRPYNSHRERMEGIIWARADRECRILLNLALVPAVVEAQKHQNISPMTIASSMSSRQTEPDERLLIVQDYEIGTARNGETFHGCIDCVILLLPSDSYSLIKVGSIPMVDNQGEPLLAIVEAGSPVDWEEARTRLSAQCIALLKSTGRKYFPAVLTNGLIWFFFLAVAQDDGGVTIYQSGIMSWTAKIEMDALIVATLVELLRNPGSLPPIFALENRRSWV
ncbi:hypothetical protein C8J57DRAFT_1716163 [Mycena rebaudengoi]|nr:hypothetical protein C8J57DRAFT_1716163 [Mycena rebaudengoi]